MKSFAMAMERQKVDALRLSTLRDIFAVGK